MIRSAMQQLHAERTLAEIDFSEIEARVLAELGPDYEIVPDGPIHDEYHYTARRKDSTT